MSDSPPIFVYASNIARLAQDFERLARGVDLLILDGAMWHRTLFSHLRINRVLPVVCRWPVPRILLTQIGRAPPHEQLEQAVSELCPKATPAWDELTLEVA